MLVRLASWIVALLVLTSQAFADVEYRYVTDQIVYNAPRPGATVTVSVFLEERVTGNSKSLVGPGGSQSLSSIAVGLVRESGDAKVSGGTANPKFNLFSEADAVNEGTEGSILVAAINNFQKAIKVGPGVNRILIGTFSIAAGSSNSKFKIVSGSEANRESNAGKNGDGTVATKSLVPLDKDGEIDGQPFKGAKSFPASFSINAKKR